MSLFEILMLVCFGAAWPVSIYKSWTTKKNAGKSFVFLMVVAVGYVAGILHKVIYHWDGVVWLYALNLVLVLTDAALWLRNRRIERNV